MKLPEDLEYELISGAAGAGFAAEFMGFVQVYRRLPDPRLILQDPDNAPVPDKTEPSILYAIASTLASLTAEKTYQAIIKYAYRLPKEFTVMLMKDALGYWEDLINTVDFRTFALDHSEFVLGD